ERRTALARYAVPVARLAMGSISGPRRSPADDARPARLSALHRGIFELRGRALLGRRTGPHQRAPRGQVVWPGGRSPEPPDIRGIYDKNKWHSLCRYHTGSIRMRLPPGPSAELTR